MPPKDPKDPLDPKNILLPKKEVPGTTPESAQRAQAGEILAQEQKAKQEGLGTPAAPKPSEPAPAPKDNSVVRPLETYQGDIQELVQSSNTSVISIAAAEAERRAKSPVGVQKQPINWKNIAYIAGGVALLCATAGIVAYFATRPSTVPVVPLDTQAPFIEVDDTRTVPIPGHSIRSALLSLLVGGRNDVHLSLGLVERLKPVTSSTDAQGNEIAADYPLATLLTTLSPEVPPSLLRTLAPDYLLGVHSYDENEAFLIIKTDSYETAYAGMLAWEPNMASDLAPLFYRTPPTHLIGTSQATSSNAGGATPAGYFGTSTPTTTPPSTFTTPAFVDRVVDNHYARVVQNSYGDILLLWTFLDRNTIVIANNENTLREIIVRLSAPPIQALPQ